MMELLEKLEEAAGIKLNEMFTHMVGGEYIDENDIKKNFERIDGVANVEIWGGLQRHSDHQNTGARYEPATDTCLPTSTTGAPSKRSYPATSL